ncbi:hypothetical protein N7462_000889 [Penicillium macrosclerotiorum]|uniref:uncharacterized protein n=1 Tax=Penicillium macrosclerotiorum TaxID=303699 RepID=UPI0025476A52|nr:uncharacterized protein N7462_000889 [Penicillium macrosclerotiorum]KAJ5698884.1 hypothetical protein N7462_000889 [Penicillium macrosclerotiorum]
MRTTAGAGVIHAEYAESAQFPQIIIIIIIIITILTSITTLTIHTSTKNDRAIRVQGMEIAKNNPDNQKLCLGTPKKDQINYQTPSEVTVPYTCTGHKIPELPKDSGVFAPKGSPSPPRVPRKPLCKRPSEAVQDPPKTLPRPPNSTGTSRGSTRSPNSPLTVP